MGSDTFATLARLPHHAVGLGLRPELAADLLASPHTVNFVEVLAESCLASAQATRQAVALSRVWPVALHGVKLSLGSAHGLDDGRVDRLVGLARSINAVCVSEHISFTRAGPRDCPIEIGHLTALPLTKEAVDTVVRNAELLQRRLPVPLLLENVAWSFRWSDNELTEEEFVTQVIRQSGCPLLLDISNLRANARNAERDPVRVLDGYPMDATAMVHVAGSVTDADGFLLDTHADPVELETFELLAHLFGRIGRRPVLLERDHAFPAFADLVRELDAVRGLEARRSSPPSQRLAERRPCGFSRAPLAQRQVEVARALVASGPIEVEGVAPRELERARLILHRKRMDEALPLLPHLSRPSLSAQLQRVCEPILSSTPRVARGVGVADAFTLAHAALQNASLAEAAQRDLLLLRARFSGPSASGTYAVRRLPFVGRTLMASGRALWMYKGLGPQSGVHALER
jgi:uncharacterized protein (UPF0276 family)